MSQYQAVHRLAGPIGADIGASDSKTQAELFNGFATMFNTTMAGELDREMQRAYIVTDLTLTARLWITQMAATIAAAKT